MLRNWGYFLITLFAGIILAFLAITPPAAQSSNIAADRFSSGRAMADVKIIATKPHPTGSAENAKVRDYLLTRMTSLGMQVSVSESELNEWSLKRLNHWSGENKSSQAIYNVIGVLPGEDRSKPALLLMAHHDTVWGSPGASDDTVGIASILEIVRALKENADRKRDIIVLFTDAEELGLVGARHFFTQNPLSNSVGAIINFEARGGGGTTNMFQTSANNGAAVRLFARSVSEPNVSSLSIFVYNILPNDTDLTTALGKNYIAYNFANLGDAQYYHSPEIDASALDEKTLQHMGSQGLDLSRALVSAEQLPSKSPDATFFDVFGLFTLIYAPFWGWVFLLIGGICYGLSASRLRLGPETIGGAARMFGFLGFGGGLLYALNRLSGAGGSADYYDRLAAIGKLEWMALLACLMLFVSMFGRKFLSANGRIGAIIPIFILGIIGQAMAPTAVYFITLPIMLCGITALLMQRWPDKFISIIIAVILSAMVLGYMIGLGHLLMLGVGPNLLMAAILPASLAAIAILPFYKGVRKAIINKLIVSGAAVSVAMALWIRFDPIASTIPLY